MATAGSVEQAISHLPYVGAYFEDFDVLQCSEQVRATEICPNGRQPLMFNGLLIDRWQRC